MDAPGSPAGHVTPFDLFSDGGETGALMRRFDWTASPLGAVESWPKSLRTCVRIILTSRQPMFVWWGPQLINLYNDAYLAILGGKHPQALGQPASVVWRELWHEIQPRAETAMHSNQGTYDEALLLIMQRHGYEEETYYTFSYSPVPNDDGSIGGIICANTDETRRIVDERRLVVLRSLEAGMARARTWQDTCTAAMEALAGESRDIPFALIYLTDSEHQEAQLAGTCGFPAEHPLAPRAVRLDVGDSPWRLAEVIATRELRHNDLASQGDLPRGGWPEPPMRAVSVPLATASETGPPGVLVIGLNPYQEFDAKYQGFVQLIAGQIAAGIAQAQAYENERRRAEALAELDRAKTVFFSNVSHELRTPLTLMLAPLEDALADQAEPLAPHQRQRQEMVHRNALRLHKLVNTLLEFSRIEAGRVRADYRPTDLAALTTDLASSFTSATAKAGLALTVTCAPIDEPVFVDRDMWERIVLNLVSNAFKYTLTGGIAIRLHAVDGAVELQVEDTGIGIAATDLPRVFDRFYRIEHAQGRTHEGSGIGLALVQELVRLHGGSLRATSVLERGSVFTVRIPLGHAHLPPGQIGTAIAPRSATIAAEPFVEEALRWLPDGEAPAEPVADAVDAQAASLGSGHDGMVVVADDNADMRAYLRTLLAGHFRVVAVGDGEAAWQQILREQPDLVLTDVMMPHLDGFGLLARIRATAATHALPVMLLSARAGEEARLEGLRAGADDYLVKPFHARELLARVNAQVALIRLRRTAFERERQLEAQRHAAHAQAAAVIAATSDGYLALDQDFCIIDMNPAAERAYSRYNREALGKNLWDFVPGLKEHEAGRVYLAAMADRRVRELVTRFGTQWFDVRVFPSETGLAIFFRDITPQKQLEEELDKRNRDLLRSNTDLAHFASIAAHDLQEPLRVATNYLDLLFRRYGATFDDRAVNYRDHILGGIDRMRAMINAVLSFSSVGELPFTPSRCATRELVQHALQHLEAKVADTKAVIRVEDDLPVVTGDAALLTQLFQNLIGNAVKFSRGAPDVRISATHSTHRDQWIFQVADRGIGIAPEHVEKVFRIFQRLHAHNVYEGSGIGLATCRRIIELHGGRIWVESELGVGSTFFFSLPKSDELG